jgi:bifunctional non-homologous end joining protein LigD
VVEIARVIRRLCEDIGLPSFVKTTGRTGLHIMIPLAGQFDYDHARLFGQLLADVTVARKPEVATTKRTISAREGKVYVDYLQNRRGQLIVAPFSVRPLPAAPVSTPLRWREVNARLDVRKHTIRTVPRRLARMKEDPCLPVLAMNPDLSTALSLLQESLGR